MLLEKGKGEKQLLGGANKTHLRIEQAFSQMSMATDTKAYRKMGVKYNVDTTMNTRGTRTSF